MLKFLTILLGFAADLLLAWQKNSWKQQGRQEAIREATDAVAKQVEQAEAAVTVPDPERDERLRNRFDRSISAE